MSLYSLTGIEVFKKNETLKRRENGKKGLNFTYKFHPRKSLFRDLLKVWRKNFDLTVLV